MRLEARGSCRWIRAADVVASGIPLEDSFPARGADSLDSPAQAPSPKPQAESARRSRG